MKTLPTPDITGLSHAEQRIRASIWNYPSLFGPRRVEKPREPKKDLHPDTIAIIQKMWNEIREDDSPYQWKPPSSLTRPKEMDEFENERYETWTLCGGRPRVIQTMLCDSGTAHMWNENGQLVAWTGVDIELEDPMNPPESQIRSDLGISTKMAQESFESLPPEEQEKWRSLQIEQIFNNSLLVREELEKLATTQVTDMEDVLGIDEHAQINFIPDNVTDDWLTVCEEAVQMILNAKEFGYKDDSQERREKMREESLERAKRAKERINQIRNSRQV